MADFATATDLAHWLRQDVDENAAAIALAKASRYIRGELGESFVSGEVTADIPLSDTLKLPSRWVTAVSEIKDVDGNSMTDWYFRGGELWFDRIPYSVRFEHRKAFVVVTFTVTVPEDVMDALKGACLDLSALAYGNPNSVLSEATDDYRIAFAFTDNGTAMARDAILAGLRSAVGVSVETVGYS